MKPNAAHHKLLVVLVLCGIGWGLTVPLAKVAVSDGYQPFGLIFWQMLLSAGFLSLILLVLRRGLPRKPPHLKIYVIIAVIGTLLPNSASFAASVHLPAGVMAICLALVPMFAFPVALAMGNDRFGWMKFGGLLCGPVGVLILTVPDASLPDPRLAIFILLALVAPMFYGIEGNYVSKYGPVDLDPIQLLCGSAIIGSVIALPLAWFSGQWIDPRGPWAAPDWALVASSLIHASVYSTYFWMVARGGAVFAAQVSYLVTGFGIVWSILLLGETYSGWIWLALVVILGGLTLVQPRAKAPFDPSGPLAPNSATGEDGI